MISVLMPTYGRPAHLEEAIEGFLRQTVTDSELVIANDWADQTLHFDHPRVRIYNMKERMSLGLKRNWLCDNCNGDLVCDWDDDDIYLPNHLEHVLSLIPQYRKKVFAKQRWIWEYRGHALFRIAPAGYVHTVIMDKKVRQSIGGYPDQIRKSDTVFLNRIIDYGCVVGPNGYRHKPTFIQRYVTGRARVSDRFPEVELDDARIVRIENELRSIGLTGDIELTPKWKMDYNKISDDSYAAVLRSGW